MSSSVSSASTAAQNKLFKDEYQNWLAVGHAFCLMNEGIRPFITREMNTFYNTLLVLSPCVCIYDNTRKKNPWHDMKACAWAKTLQGHHHGNRPKWNQSDSCKWTDPNLGCWEIAKLFMSDLGKHKSLVVDAQSTDVTGLMNILCWCKHFHVLRPYAEQVRDARNIRWGHTPDLEISLADKNIVFQNIENLLTAGALSKDPDAQNALQQIKYINTKFDAQNLERKILLDFGLETKNVLEDMKTRLNQCEGKRGKDRKEMERLRRRLDCYENMLKKLNKQLQMETYWFLPLWFMVFHLIFVWNKTFRKNSKSCLIALILIVCAVQLDPNTYDDKCPSEDRMLHFDVKEFNFSRQLNTARQGFVGRKWLFEDIKSKLKNPNTSTVLIVGDPGSGKSAVAAHLICSRKSDFSINQHIIAYHLCQYYNKETQEPGRFIRNLVDLIARRFPEYENIILNKSLVERLRRHDCEGYPHECFEEAIIMPLKEVFKSNQPNQNDLYYIVLDALDECIPAQGSPVTTIVELIKDKAPRFPKTIKIIATTRNDSSFIKDVESSAEVIAIDPVDPRNEEDIAFYIDSAPNRRFNFIDKILKYFDFRSKELNMKESQYLVRIGQGNFLFVKLLAHYQQFDSDYVTTTPKTLGQVYEKYFRRSYTTRDFKQVRGALEILVSTLQPFSTEDIFSVLRLHDNDLVYEYFLRDFNTLSQFLRYGENNTVSLFHKSLEEWLTAKGNQRYFIQKKEGHKKLILYYINLIKNRNNNSYFWEPILYLAQHIAYGDVFQKYFDVFHNLSSQIIKSSKIKNKDDTSYLHLAAAIKNPLIIKLFLQYFQDNVDCTDSRGLTPAFISASLGLLNNVKLLVNHGANVNHKTNPPPPLPFKSFEDPVEISKREFWGSTMLHAAAQQGYLDVVEFLVGKNASIFEKNGVSLTALQLAAEKGHLKIVQLLYNNGARVDQLALHHSAMNGHVDVVQFLLDKGVTDDCMRCDGSFYWLEGNQRYQSLWIDVGLELPSNDPFEHIFIQEIRSSKGLDYMLFDDNSLLYCETALHASVAKTQLDIVRVLISHNGASTTCTDYTGRTPLHLAAARNNLEIIDLLINAGARTAPKCSFIQYTKLTHLEDSMYYMKKHKHLSLKEDSEYFSDICSCDHTPIDVAAAFGHIESTRLLLHHDGSLAKTRDCNGASLLHIAACNGQHHFIRWIIDYIRDIKIDSPSANGSTPLHSAAYCGKLEGVKQLISGGANTQVLDTNNMTVLHYTASNSASAHLIWDLICFENDTQNKELYYSNKYVSVWKQKNADGLVYAYTLKYKFILPNNCTFRELVYLDENCLTLKELVKNPRILLNSKDSTGKTVLDLALTNGLDCITIEVLKRIRKSGNVKDMFHHLSYDLIKGRQRDVSFLLLLPFLDKYHLLQSAIANHRPDWMYFLHEKSMKFPTVFLKRSVLPYLQSVKRSKAIESMFLDLEVTFDIECDKPFLESHLHLVAFWPPSDVSDNFFYTRECNQHRCYYISGPIAIAITEHPQSWKILNNCRDLEGYTPLHRAAQGGNIIAIKYFLDHGADITATTTNWNQNALELAVSYAGFRYTVGETNGIDSDVASNTSILLLKNSPHVKIICDGSATKLTIYHIAAYRGMVRFVKEILENSEHFGIDVDCPDVNGITPLYLAKLRVGKVNISSDDDQDPWLEVTKLIEIHGGKLRFPFNLESEHHVLYRHLYGSMNFDDLMSQHDFLEDMERLYSDETAIKKCLKGSTNLKIEFENYANFLTDFDVSNISAFQAAKEEDILVKVLNLELGLALQDLFKRLKKTLNSNVEATSNANLMSDTHLTKLNSEVTPEDEISIEKQIMDLHKMKKERKILGATASKQEKDVFGLFKKENRCLRSFDVYTKQLQDILDRQRKYVSSHLMTSLEKKLRKLKQKCFCHKMAKLIRYFLLLFSVYQGSARTKDKLSFQLVGQAEFPFVVNRLPLTAFPDEGDCKNRDLKTLVRGVRYLLDLVMDKKTKYDYLKILTLGKAPGTRLFYDNENEEDRLERSLISQKKRIEQTRLALKMYMESLRYKQGSSNNTYFSQHFLPTCYKIRNILDLC